MILAVETTITRHAECRLQQRGIQLTAVDLIIQHADREQHVGNGCTKLRLSRLKKAALRKNGIPARLLERTENIVLLIGENGQIITVMHDTGRHCRRYRQQSHTHR